MYPYLMGAAFVLTILVAVWSLGQYRAGSLSHQKGDMAFQQLFAPADQGFVITDNNGVQRPATKAEVLDVLIAERVAKWKADQQASQDTPRPSGQ